MKDCRSVLAPSGRAPESRSTVWQWTSCPTVGAVAAVGYETLLYDCLIGDATLFQRADTVEAAWRTVQGLLNLLGTWAFRQGLRCGRQCRP